MSSSWPADGPRVLIMNAYSAGNAGDGLLIELASETVRLALAGADIRVVCSDAASFKDPYRFVQWRGPADGEPSTLRRQRISMVGATMIGAAPQIRDLVRQADLVLGVGGGYLRGGHMIESLKSYGAHVGQIQLARSAADRTVYLPQSIGPFRHGYGKIIRRALSPMRMVCVRDDRSVRTLSGLSNVRRYPDLAVLALSRRPPKRREVAGGRPVFVARELKYPRSYYDLLADVASSGRFDWAVQSIGRGNNDFPLTQRLSATIAPPRLADVLAEGPSRVVVSTRLHGAMGAIMTGHLAIHLSYERKGWGAFEDLGIPDLVLNARDATFGEVMSKVEAVQADPDSYWSRIHDGLDRLRGRDRSLIDELAKVCRTGRVG